MVAREMVHNVDETYRAFESEMRSRRMIAMRFTLKACDTTSYVLISLWLIQAKFRSVEREAFGNY